MAQHKGRSAGSVLVKLLFRAEQRLRCPCSRCPCVYNSEGPVVARPLGASADTHLMQWHKRARNCFVSPRGMPLHNQLATAALAGAQFIRSTSKSVLNDPSSSTGDVAIPMGAGNDLQVGLSWDL